jgi:hypothetical protein
MSNLRAAAQQALEALEYLNVTAEHRVDDRIPDAAIVALRAALAQEEQKPVAIKDDDGLTLKAGWDDLPVGTPLYTTPPRREWQGLTEQRDELLAALQRIAGYDLPDEAAIVEVARAAIAKAEGKS